MIEFIEKMRQVVVQLGLGGPVTQLGPNQKGYEVVQIGFGQNGATGEVWLSAFSANEAFMTDGFPIGPETAVAVAYALSGLPASGPMWSAIEAAREAARVSFPDADPTAEQREVTRVEGAAAIDDDCDLSGERSFDWPDDEGQIERDADFASEAEELGMTAEQYQAHCDKYAIDVGPQDVPVRRGNDQMAKLFEQVVQIIRDDKFELICTLDPTVDQHGAQKVTGSYGDPTDQIELTCRPGAAGKIEVQRQYGPIQVSPAGLVAMMLANWR